MFARFLKASQRHQAIFLSTLIACTPTLLITSSASAQQRDAAYVYRPTSKNLSDSELVPFVEQLSVATESGKVPTSFNTADVSLKEALLIVGCDTPTDECMDQLAQTTSVQRTYYVIIEREQNLYRVNFNYYDLGTHQFEKAERFIKRSPKAPQLFYEFALGFLSGQLSNTRLNVFTKAENLDLRIEGRDFGPLPRSVETLVPDTYTIWVGRNGEQKWTDEITLSNDRPYTVDIAEDAITGKFNITKSEGVQQKIAPTTVSSSSVVDNTKSSTIHWGVWTLLGLGSASVVTGAVLGALVKKKEAEANAIYREFEIKSVQPTTPQSEITALNQRQSKINKSGRLFETLEFTAFGVGAVALLGGIIWLTYDLVKKTSQYSTPQTTAGLIGQSLQAQDTHMLDSDNGVKWSMSLTPSSVQSTLVW